MWWAKRAKRVLTFESDKDWYDKLEKRISSNVDLFFVSMQSPAVTAKQIGDILGSYDYPKYDIIVIDGLYRYEMIKVAREVVSATGAVICDDSEGYGFFKGFEDSGLNRVDFFGNAAGVVLPRCTSIFFGPDSFLFNCLHPIPVASDD